MLVRHTGNFLSKITKAWKAKRQSLMTTHLFMIHTSKSYIAKHSYNFINKNKMRKWYILVQVPMLNHYCSSNDMVKRKWARIKGNIYASFHYMYTTLISLPGWVHDHYTNMVGGLYKHSMGQEQSIYLTYRISPRVVKVMMVKMKEACLIHFGLLSFISLWWSLGKKTWENMMQGFWWWCRVVVRRLGLRVVYNTVVDN